MSSMEGYDREYRAHVQAAEARFEEAERTLGDERRAALTAADRAVEAAKDTVQLMELEGRSAAGSSKGQLQEKLRAYRQQVAQLRARARELRTATPDRDREALFAGGSYRDETPPGERSRMLSANERLEAGSDRIKGAHAVVVDMEETAGSILGELGKQRQTLLHSQTSLRGASAGLEGAGRVLNQMARRAFANKLTMYLVIGTILLFIVWLVYSGSSDADVIVAEVSAGAHKAMKKARAEAGAQAQAQAR